MFQNLAQLLAATPNQDQNTIFLLHPIQLSRWLDEAWEASALRPPLPGTPPNQAPFLGSQTVIADLDLPGQTAPDFLDPSGIDPANAGRWTRRLGPQQLNPATPGLAWHHLIYSYLVESTGVYEILAEVVRRLVMGETLGALRPPSVSWLRTTEELFFRDPPLFSISGVVSELRPHNRVNRRNAYWRMFGFDLPHGVPPQTPGGGAADSWKQGLGSASNTDFRAKWTELLRQVWMGLKNRSNQSGPNPTDPSYIALLCAALQDMMNNRRRGGQLAREEFAYVTALSWFDLTVRANTPIVVDLKAEASFADQRLGAIAERVGMTPSARTRELLQLAEPVSALLRAVELGVFSAPAQAAALYTGNTPLTEDMNDIINLWQSATGDRVKDQSTTIVPAVNTQPLRIPKPSEMASTNGSRG